jgi:phosphoglycolate phosphatase-like HAD superfamily hydrolase
VLRLLALDFDGVISDSAPEAFVVALRTWCEMRPGSRLGDRRELLDGAVAPSLERVSADPLFADFLAMMALGNRAEDYAVELDAIEAGASIPDQAAYDRYKDGVDAGRLRAFHKRFYRVRAALFEADPERWHGLMACYPGIPGLLRRRAGDVVLAIATSKDRRSVARLLEAYGIDDLFPEGRVLDKETGVSKRDHLEHLHRVHGAGYPEMAFVDDKVNHLDAVAPLGVQCGLAAWGYNGDREVALARAHGHRVLGLDDVEEQLFGSPGSPSQEPGEG